MSLKYDYILKKMRLSDKTDSILPYHEIKTTIQGKNNNAKISGFEDNATNPDGWKLNEQTEPSTQLLSVLNTITNIKSGAILQVWQTTESSQTLLNQRICGAENLNSNYQRIQVIQNGIKSWGAWYETDETTIEDLSIRIQTLEDSQEKEDITYQIGIAIRTLEQYQTQKFDIVELDMEPSINDIPISDKSIHHVQLSHVTDAKYNNQYFTSDIFNGYLMNFIVGPIGAKVIQLIMVPIIVNNKTIIRYYYRTGNVKIGNNAIDAPTDFVLYDDENIASLNTAISALTNRVTTLENTPASSSNTTPKFRVVEHSDDLGDGTFDEYKTLEVSYDNGETWAELTIIHDGRDGIDGEHGSEGAAGVAGADGANGADGVTPQLRSIDNGTTHELQVSYDNGLSWETLTILRDGQDGQDGSSNEPDLSAAIPVINVRISSNSVQSLSAQVYGNTFNLANLTTIQQTTWPCVIDLGSYNACMGSITLLGDGTNAAQDIQFSINEYVNSVAQTTTYKIFRIYSNSEWGNWQLYKATLKDSSVFRSKDEDIRFETSNYAQSIANVKFKDQNDNRTNTAQIISGNDYGNSNNGYLSLEHYDSNNHHSWIRIKSNHTIQLSIYDSSTDGDIVLDLNATKLKQLQQLLSQS